MPTLNYTPPVSLVPFLLSRKFIDLAVGPIGSTKTTAGIMRIAFLASRMAPCHDGIRRSKCVWVRNTREQLKDTSIPDFLRWFPDGLAGVMAKTDLKFTLRFDDVECEVLFRGLDDANDVRRLLSVQASFGVLDEFREIRQEIFEALQGRLGRYPNLLDNGVGCVDDQGVSLKHLWGMSNPPDVDTFWETYLSDPPANTDVTIQPSGLDPAADWVNFLPVDYYQNLMQGKSQDWIDVYIHGQFGRSLAGKPVFREFKPDWHIAKSPLIPVRGTDRPLIIGMDFGLNPSCTINQIDYFGRLLCYHAETSDGMGIQRFLQTRLKPILANRFPGMPCIVIGDPGGNQRVQTDEKTCFDYLRMEGFQAAPIPMSANSIIARIAAVDYFLAGQVQGGPRMLVDPEHARPLIKALRGGYRYKAKKNGEFETEPEKNESSHIADAHQYACIHAGGWQPQFRSSGRRDVQSVKSGGWT